MPCQHYEVRVPVSIARFSCHSSTRDTCHVSPRVIMVPSHTTRTNKNLPCQQTDIQQNQATCGQEQPIICSHVSGGHQRLRHLQEACEASPVAIDSDLATIRIAKEGSCWCQWCHVIPLLIISLYYVYYKCKQKILLNELQNLMIFLEIQFLTSKF